MTKIKDLPPAQRPREKLLRQGAEKLTDAELVAILLRTGTRDKSALEVAKDIMKNADGSFRGLAGKDFSEVSQIPGVKEAKVVTLAAALEIARRISGEVLEDRGII